MKDSSAPERTVEALMAHIDTLQARIQCLEADPRRETLCHAETALTLPQPAARERGTSKEASPPDAEFLLRQQNQHLQLLHHIAARSWSHLRPAQVLAQVVALLQNFYTTCRVDVMLFHASSQRPECPDIATLEAWPRDLQADAQTDALLNQEIIDLPTIPLDTCHPALRRCAERCQATALYGLTFNYADNVKGLISLNLSLQASDDPPALHDTPATLTVLQKQILIDVVDYLTLLLRDAIHADERDQALLALQRSESILRAVFATMPAYVWFKDKEGIIQLANHRFMETIPNHPDIDPVGKTVEQIWPLERAHRYLAQDHEVQRTHRPIKAEECLEINGQLRWAEIIKAPIMTHDGELIGIVGCAHEITEHKEYQAVMQQVQGQLEHRVAERTAELQAANQELEAFSYSVSHDLRAPLRAIDGFTHIILRDCAASLSVDARGYLNKVIAATTRMNLLINNLLDLSRTARADIRKVRVDLSRIVQEVADTLTQRDPERAVEIEVAPDLCVVGDAGLMRIALDNLLGNAWKFSQYRRPAHIRVGRDSTLPGHPFYVQDNGAGFDMNYADKLFSPFQRLHGAKEFEGTGIGLAMVKRIIQRHGGSIWVDSVVNVGTTLYFTLPDVA